MGIDGLAVQAELGRILGSRCFRTCKALRKFLAYVVTQSVAGRGGDISQYTVAVRGLGKGAGFNAAKDPIVRIQASRLRRQLDDYYSTEGRFDPLRISLPMRSYRPSFVPHNGLALPGEDGLKGGNAGGKTAGPACQRRGKGDVVAFTVRLPRAEWERIHHLAVAEGVSVQAFVSGGVLKVFGQGHADSR